ncbi:suppressor of fused domain protein [Pseudoxanthomonas sp. PXM02]|uniref:suppressor of fused domain protein n=1 Tax=Pseudoxanthomonas sp. PXM02 TaxID=2769294 RepID=UPI00177D316F|nr:suppressor of fused domain protein [Pseudoxanthomonas sp. PXM02]MBD9480593.1 suppressor of fused domain protein [Pseudoxanthomonas sp. PXM02]
MRLDPLPSAIAQSRRTDRLGKAGMLQRLRTLMGAAPDPLPAFAAARAAALHDALGEPIRVDLDPDRRHRVDVHVYARTFADDRVPGYMLATSGMSDRLMTMPAGYDGDESAARELFWYVREPTSDFIERLRWLAKLPFTEDSWLGYGHTVPLPTPPLEASPFSTFLLLPPALPADRHLFDNLHLHGHGVEALVVHLLSDAEYDLVRSDEGLDVFLDLLDVHRYPQVFDPARASYL